MSRSTDVKKRRPRPRKLGPLPTPKEKAVKRGRKAIRLVLVLYRDGRHIAGAILHPKSRRYLLHTARGENAARAAFMDEGWDFGPVYPANAVPVWAQARIPEQCALLGYAHVTCAPLSEDLYERNRKAR